MEDILPVRAPGVSFYVLKDRAGLYLIDAGFVGGLVLLRKALQARGWQQEKIRGILITHGHLDHILNVHELAEATGAWIAAPALDADYYQGKASHQRWARVTGFLESLGRPLLGFHPFEPTRWLQDGDEMDIWDGLQAIHLPGHTPGHTGYYCKNRRLLFSGDLFASYGRLSHWPPTIFNDQPELLGGSVRRALMMDIEGVLPNHGDKACPWEHLHRLRALTGLHQ